MDLTKPIDAKSAGVKREYWKSSRRKVVAVVEAVEEMTSRISGRPNAPNRRVVAQLRMGKGSGAALLARILRFVKLSLDKTYSVEGCYGPFHPRLLNVIK